jgi:hypothetical protein
MAGPAGKSTRAGAPEQLQAVVKSPRLAFVHYLLNCPTDRQRFNTASGAGIICIRQLALRLRIAE